MITDILIHPSDLRGFGRLAADATAGITGLVEAMHRNIALAPGAFARSPQGPAPGIAGAIYRSIGAGAKLAGKGLDLSLDTFLPLAPSERSSRARDTILGAANGILGDHLSESGNPLAVEMRFRRNGKVLPLGKAAMTKAIPQATGKVVVLVHGLCMNDQLWNWKHKDEDVAEGEDCALATRLSRDQGCTSVYLNYNSGLHVSTNGRRFAEMLESLLGEWPVPVESLAIIGHSMGGLVARSACHYGSRSGHSWLQQLSKLVFLGTPHHGSPLERGGNLMDITLGISPYTAPFAKLGQVRSGGITDLRHGNLLDDDWADGDRFERRGDQRIPVPLPEGVACYAVAATTGAKLAARSPLATDLLVPVNSALGLHKDPKRVLSFAKSHQFVVDNCNHFGMLHRPEVHDKVAHWLAD